MKKKKIDPSHKSHTCTFLLQNGALWDMELVHCCMCATGLFDAADGVLAQRDRSVAVMILTSFTLNIPRSKLKECC